MSCPLLGSLACTRTEPHDRGHVYMSSSLGDKHDASEQAAEEARG